MELVIEGPYQNYFGRSPGNFMVAHGKKYWTGPAIFPI
jgi:hypothetical protein